MLQVVERMPEGCTLERVRRLEPSAVLLDVAVHRIFWVGKGGGLTELPPAEHIVGFGELCLVRVEGDPSWWMGEVDRDGGSIVCWGTYGPDLEAAISGL